VIWTPVPSPVRGLVRRGKWAEGAAQSPQGCEVLAEIPDPSVSWLHAPRLDLAEAYDTLGEPREAERFRRERERFMDGGSGEP